MRYYVFTFSQRIRLINYLFDLARKQRFQQDRLLVRESLNDKYSEAMLTEILDSVLDILDEESRRIMVNDFKVRADKQWWQHFYSRSTYYRLKTKATEEFLDYLHAK